MEVELHYVRCVAAPTASALDWRTQSQSPFAEDAGVFLLDAVDARDGPNGAMQSGTLRVAPDGNGHVYVTPSDICSELTHYDVLMTISRNACAYAYA
jgi:hypothetical protein